MKQNVDRAAVQIDKAARVRIPADIVRENRGRFHARLHGQIPQVGDGERVFPGVIVDVREVQGA